MTLYEIADNMRDIIEMVEENDGQYDDDMLLSVWESIDEDLKDKTDSWCKVIKGMKADEDKLTEEIHRLEERRKSLRNNQVRMKDTLCTQLKAMEVDKLKTPMFTVYALKENSKLVYDSSLIGDEYRVEYVTKKIDEKAVKEAIANGENIAGARLYSSLTIR